MTTTSPIDDLARAVEVTGEVISSLQDHEWAQATPCTEWDVRALATHLIGGNARFAAVLRGEEPTASPGAPQTGATPVDGDLAAAYWDSAQQLLAAFREPGALERPVRLPIGTVPGIAALQLRITELLTHGWDLASATGRPAQFPEDLAEQALAFTRARLSDLPPGHSPFGPPQPAPADAATIDRLAAALGRPLAPEATDV